MIMIIIIKRIIEAKYFYADVSVDVMTSDTV